MGLVLSAVVCWASAGAGGGVAPDAVQVLSSDRNDVVVVAQLASFGREAQVGNGRDGDIGLGSVQSEAVGPGVLGLILQV